MNGEVQSQFELFVLQCYLFMNHLVLRAKLVGLDCLEVLSK